MNRRDVLKFLSSLPLVGLLLRPKEVAGKLPERTPVVDLPSVDSINITIEQIGPSEPRRLEKTWTVEPQEWERLAERLSLNLHRYVDENLPKFEVGLLHAICVRFCRNLRNWDLSVALDDAAEVAELEKVQFVVMTAPVELIAHPDTGEEVVLQAEARKLRVLFRPDIYAALQTYNDFDVEVEMCERYAREAAFDVQMELRQHIREGRPVRVYALYMPPHIGPTHVDTTEFSVRRGFRIRYAKVV
jgi:hypothetical protein